MGDQGGNGIILVDSGISIKQKGKEKIGEPKILTNCFFPNWLKKTKQYKKIKNKLTFQ